MIKQQLKELSTKHPQYGFRTLFGILRSQGHNWNHKRVRRLYCELNLNLKRRPKKRLSPRTARELAVPTYRHHTWSIDFMHDVLTGGRRFRTMNVVDDHRRECLGIKVSYSLPSTETTKHLDEIASIEGYPKYIRLDNGPEHIAKHFKDWAESHKIGLLYIQPGKPAKNAYIEQFNRTYREAILDMYLFDSLQEVKELTEKWIPHYNHQRPHQLLGMLKKQGPSLNRGRRTVYC